jgi:hypothetical protein
MSRAARWRVTAARVPYSQRVGGQTVMRPHAQARPSREQPGLALAWEGAVAHGSPWVWDTHAQIFGEILKPRGHFKHDLYDTTAD